MTKDEYRQHLFTCIAAARLLSSVPIGEMLRAIALCDAVGPVLNPTLWRDGHEKMHEDRKLLEASLPLRDFARGLAAAEQNSDGIWALDTGFARPRPKSSGRIPHSDPDGI